MNQGFISSTQILQPRSNSLSPYMVPAPLPDYATRGKLVYDMRQMPWGQAEQPKNYVSVIGVNPTVLERYASMDSEDSDDFSERHKPKPYGRQFPMQNTMAIGVRAPGKQEFTAPLPKKQATQVQSLSASSIPPSSNTSLIIFIVVLILAVCFLLYRKYGMRSNS